MGAKRRTGLSIRRLQLASIKCVHRYGVELTSKTDNWDISKHPMKRNEFGVWEIVVPAVNGQPAIPHNSKLKVLRFCLADL